MHRYEHVASNFGSFNVFFFFFFFFFVVVVVVVVVVL